MLEFEAEVSEVIQRTHNVKSFRFKGKADIDFKAGQFFFVALKIGSEERTKHFSFSNSPTEKGYIEFTKKLTESEYSKALDRLKAGDRARLKMPYGSFTFEGGYERIAFLSGGIGITPIRSICRYVVDKKMGTDIVLLYGNRTANDIVFREDFDVMQGEYPKLKVVHILSEAEPEWKGIKGRIAARTIKEEIPDYAERRFYICGPPSMVEAMKNILSAELGLSEEGIITENFTGY
jgi:ferredoxin-NADP reductase